MKETKQDYAIFVDSSADLSPSLLQDGKLQMVAMSYTNGAENCELAGVASDSAMKAFYDGQRRGNLTRTSQVSPQQFIDAFTPALQSGRRTVFTLQTRYSQGIIRIPGSSRSIPFLLQAASAFWRKKRSRTGKPA